MVNNPQLRCVGLNLRPYLNTIHHDDRDKHALATNLIHQLRLTPLYENLTTLLNVIITNIYFKYFCS